jgi:hypothetical protein
MRLRVPLMPGGTFPGRVMLVDDGNDTDTDNDIQ